MFEIYIACCEQVKQQRMKVYRQLKLFSSPFYFAYSWEKKLGGSHARVANTLIGESSQLNNTIALLRYQYIVSTMTSLTSPHNYTFIPIIQLIQQQQQPENNLFDFDSKETVVLKIMR